MNSSRNSRMATSPKITSMKSTHESVPLKHNVVIAYIGAIV